MILIIANFKKLSIITINNYWYFVKLKRFKNISLLHMMCTIVFYYIFFCIFNIYQTPTHIILEAIVTKKPFLTCYCIATSIAKYIVHLALYQETMVEMHLSFMYHIKVLTKIFIFQDKNSYADISIPLLYYRSLIVIYLICRCRIIDARGMYSNLKSHKSCENDWN